MEPAGQFENVSSVLGMAIKGLIMAPLVIAGCVVLMTLAKAVFTVKNTESVIEKPRYFTSTVQRNRVRAELMELDAAVPKRTALRSFFRLR